ncbi:MAG: hypothetical protein AAGJ54_05730 [Planctomycetota bacterium]
MKNRSEFFKLFSRQFASITNPPSVGQRIGRSQIGNDAANDALGVPPWISRSAIWPDWSRNPSESLIVGNRIDELFPRVVCLDDRPGKITKLRF